MKRSTLVMIPVITCLIASNVICYVKWRAERDRLDEIVKNTAFVIATMDARFAVQKGDYRLYEPVDSLEQIRPVRQDGQFVVHDVNIAMFATESRSYWRWYFEMYNLKVRRNTAIRDDPDQHVFAAIKSARQRGEWQGIGPPDLNENGWGVGEWMTRNNVQQAE